MKTLAKLAMVVMVITLASCNEKKDSQKKSKELQKQEQLNIEKAEFNSDSKTLATDRSVFLQECFKEREVSLFEDVSEYATIFSGQHISYYRNGKIFKGVLNRPIIAIIKKDMLLINDGYIVKTSQLKYAKKKMKIHVFPKLMDTKTALKFINKYEGTYVLNIDTQTRFILEAEEYLETLLENIYIEDNFGEGCDSIYIFDVSYGIEFEEDVFIYDNSKNKKDTRKVAQEKRGEKFTE